MAYDSGGVTGYSRGRPRWQWCVVVTLLASLVGVPGALVVAIEFGLLAALGLSGQLAFGVIVMIPGLVLGALSLVVMLGS